MTEIRIRRNTDTGYLQELVCVMLAMKKLVKNPEHDLKNYFSLSGWAFGIGIPLDLLLMAAALTQYSWQLGGLAILLGIVLCLLALFVYRLNRKVYALKKAGGTDLWKIDEKGLSLKEESGRKRELAWDEIAGISCFSRSIVFLPKEGDEIRFNADRTYYEAIYYALQKEKSPISMH